VSEAAQICRHFVHGKSIQSAMKSILAIGLVLVAALGFFALAGREPAAAQSANGARTPVVVELFTSEGCSSCPPADALIARLARTQPVAGAEIIPLKLHVDYWNRLGWNDRFSSAAFTARQSQYADFFDNNSVYTPQMVVDGRTEFIGSSESKALGAIADAARESKAAIELRAEPKVQNALTIAIRIAALSARTPGENAYVILAVTEDGLHSDVRSGENAGRSMDHMAVVRVLRPLTQLKPGQTENSLSTTLALDPAWKREHLHAVVFVQEENSRRVLAAGTLPLSAGH
jgi:hypothetical protein